MRFLVETIFFKLHCKVKMSESSGIKMAHVNKRLPKLKEYILIYKKEKFLLNEVKRYLKRKMG